MQPVPLVLQVVLNESQAPSDVEVVSSEHYLSVQAVVAVAASVFQHLRVNPEQVALVP